LIDPAFWGVSGSSLEKGRSWRTARHTRGHFAWKANRKNARLLELNSRSGKWEVD
jgi:hypothetical protein